MENLQKLLLQEQAALQQIAAAAAASLKDAPPGTLRISHSKKYPQFYHYVPHVTPLHGIYLPKSQKDLIHQLAQKSYDQKVLHQAQKRLFQLQQLLKDYKNDEIDLIYQNEHPERQKLIAPIKPTWSQMLQKWIEEEYTPKTISEETPVLYTERGERVRSKSEKILADYFFKNNIPYKYEKPLYLNGYGTVFPDFTFLSKKQHQEIFWEHEGRMDDPVYARSAIKKIECYAKNNIFPGDRLILTFETSETMVNTRILDSLVRKFLL